MATNNKNEKYAYLNRLSTQQLEELLRADIESPGKSDVDVVFHILEVIEKRENEHPTGRLPTEDEAWEEFQQYYNIPEGEGLSLYPTEDMAAAQPAGQAQASKIIRLRPALKVAAIVAAIVVGVFGIMVGAQAAGIDVFGAIGRWTEEAFHFVTSPGESMENDSALPAAPEDNSVYTALQTALENCGITEKLVPTWYPEGVVALEPKVSSTDYNDSVFCSFSGPEDKFFKIQVRRYYSASDMESHTFEKDSATMEEYTSKGRTFFIMSNMDATTATWSDNFSLMLNITGNISKDDIKAMIDSIGG